MKIKPLTKEQIIISTDRLTRFKNPQIKYFRVFSEIILHNLISPKFNKSELEKMPFSDLKKYAQEVFNYSVNQIFGTNSSDFSLNKKLYEYESSVFNIDTDTKILLNNQIDYLAALRLLQGKLPANLQWLIALSESRDIKKERNELCFKYPVELVVLAEGATEETLLPEFAKLYGFDFDKNGVYLIPAGGKNQVVKLYYELCETLKIPIFVLLDKDGAGNAKEIEPKLRSCDKIHIIKSGEFEDILSEDLVSRTLDNVLQNISEINFEIKEEKGHRVQYLEEIFKHRGMHEFKKVEFAQAVRDNIISDQDLTEEIAEIIEGIKKIKSDY